MPLLFTYGTLQQEDVQLSTFGRRLDGERDELLAFEPALVPITDPLLAAKLGKTHHANVTQSGDESRRVAGVVLDVTDAELTSVDAYERPFAYRRIEATLGSGRRAWVYVHGDSAR